MKEEHDHSPKSETLDNMVEDILKFEDQINKITLNLENESEENKKLLDSITKDMEKNFSRIELLRQLIQAEEKQKEKETERKETEKKKIGNILNDLEEEIQKIKQQANLSDLTETKAVAEQKKNLEVTLCEKNLQDLLQKKVKYEGEINQQKNMLEEIRLELEKLKSEKQNSETELVNLISFKETIEDLVNINHFKLLGNLRDSLDETAILLDNEILQYEELVSINFENFVKRLYISFKELLNVSFIKKFNDEKQIHLPQEDFGNLIIKLLNNFRDNKGMFQIEDLFILLTKKVYDLLISFNMEHKSMIKEINLEKLRIFLKFSLQIEHYDQAIHSKESFIVKDYKLLKKDKERSVIEIETKINNIQTKLDKLEQQESEVLKSIDTIRNTPSPKNDKLEAIASLNEKLKTLIDMKNDLNLEMQSLEEKVSLRIKSYLEQIEEIEKINEILGKRKVETINKLEKLKLDKNEETTKLRCEIADKFKEIKDSISKLDNREHDTRELVNMYINKINKLLINREEFFKKDQNVTFTSPVKSKHNHTSSFLIKPSYNFENLSNSDRRLKRNLSFVDFPEKETKFLTSRNKDMPFSKFLVDSSDKHKQKKSDCHTVSKNSANDYSGRSIKPNRSKTKSLIFDNSSPDIRYLDRSRSRSNEKHLIKSDSNLELKNHLTNLKQKIFESTKYLNHVDSDNLKIVMEKVSLFVS